MRRGAIAVLAILLAVFLALVATGTVRVPWLFPADGPTSAAPAIIEDASARDARLAAATLAAEKKAKAPDEESESAREPSLPSEVRGTAPERGGGTIVGRVVVGAKH